MVGNLGEFTYGKVECIITWIASLSVMWSLQAVLFFSANVACGTADQNKGFVMIKWYRKFGRLAESHGMRELRWEQEGTR